VLREQRLDPADPRAVDAPAALGDDLGPGRVVPREVGRAQRELDEPVGPARFLRVQVRGGIEAVDLAGDLDDQVVRRELRDRPDSVSAGADPRPEVVDAGPDRRHGTDAGDHDARALAHRRAP
jgi:hypothetical protein